MRSRIFRPVLLFVIVVSGIFACGAFAEDYLQARAAIGVKTVSSGGRYTVSQVSQIAKKNGIDVVIVADAFLNRWQYGLWPLRAIIKKTEETRSVCTYGIRRYLEGITLARKDFREIVIIDGVEVAPFYRWEGKPFRRDFAIKDWHKHLIVIGLKDASDYKKLPVIGNGTFLSRPFGFKSLLYLLFPALSLAAGLFCLLQGRGAQSDVYERRCGFLLMHWRYCGIVITATGFLLALNNYPFRDFIYDQYHGDRGAMPYQNVINYVNKCGGMIFWAHPEAKNIDKVGDISIETGEHAGLLLETQGYTGFSVFYEGYNIVGRPQGVWDGLLREYCEGARRSPVWVIGTIDYEKAGDLGEWMKNLRTVLLVKTVTAEETLKALREGRMYVSRDADAGNFSLDYFTVGDRSGDPEAVMGQAVVLNGTPRIKLKGHFSKTQTEARTVKMLLIRDGEPISIFETEAPFNIVYDDTNAAKSGRHYYRVEIRSKRLLLVTNPVFVTAE